MGVIFPWDEMSMGQNVMGANCHGEMSGQVTMGELSGLLQLLGDISRTQKNFFTVLQNPDVAL